MKRRAIGLALAFCCVLGAMLPAPLHAHRRTILIETATITFYTDSGITHSGTLTTEGRTAGCGWDAPDGATVTFLNSGQSFICEDKGLTTGPWVDLFAWSDADGYALEYANADSCPSMCYAEVEFQW